MDFLRLILEFHRQSAGICLGKGSRGLTLGIRTVDHDLHMMIGHKLGHLDSVVTYARFRIFRIAVVTALIEVSLHEEHYLLVVGGALSGLERIGGHHELLVGSGIGESHTLLPFTTCSLYPALRIADSRVIHA